MFTPPAVFDLQNTYLDLQQEWERADIGFKRLESKGRDVRRLDKLGRLIDLAALSPQPSVVDSIVLEIKEINEETAKFQTAKSTFNCASSRKKDTMLAN